MLSFYSSQKATDKPLTVELFHLCKRNFMKICKNSDYCESSLVHKLSLFHAVNRSRYSLKSKHKEDSGHLQCIQLKLQ